MLHNENLTNIVIDTLQVYSGLETSEEILKKIRKDLNVVFNEYLSKNYVYKDDFPIEFENEFGWWKINKDGETTLIKKQQAKYIEVNITILPTGEIKYE